MSGAMLWPIAGAASVGLARATAVAVNSGLSFAAELAQEMSGAAISADSRAKGAANGRREAIQRRIEQFAERVKQQLEAAGIDLSKPLTLTADGLGGLTPGDHPQRAAIEELMQTDYLLLRDFERLQDEHQAAGDEAASSPLEIVVTKAEEK
jgi:hypothetical protein